MKTKTKMTIDAKSAEALQNLKGSVKFFDTEFSQDTVEERSTDFIKWSTTLVDADDGSGDCFIEFPYEILVRLGWEVGDTIDFEIKDNNQVILRRVG